MMIDGGVEDGDLDGIDGRVAGLVAVVDVEGGVVDRGVACAGPGAQRLSPYPLGGDRSWEASWA